MDAEALRALLHTPEPDAIQQAVELLHAIGNDDLTHEMIEGLPQLSRPWQRRVQLLLAGHFPELCWAPRRVTLRGDDLDHLWCLGGPHLRLRHLTLVQGRNLTDLSALPPLRGRLTLHMAHLPVGDLSGLTAPDLRALHLRGLYRLHRLDALQRFPALEQLTVAGCESLQAIGPLPARVRALRVRGCRKLAEVTGLQAHSLAALELSELPELSLDPPLSSPSLRHLTARGVPVVDLSALPRLETLDIQRCAVRNLTAPQRALRLHQATLFDDALPDLSGVKVSIRATAAHQLRALSGLEGAQLTHLELSGCSRLEDLSALRGQRLRALRLMRAKKLKDLSPISRIEGLRELDMSALHGRQPASLRTMGLEGLLAMASLRIHQSSRLGSLAGIETLPSLAQLRLTSCRRLKDFRGIEALPALELLDLQGSPWAGPDAARASGQAARRRAALLAERSPEIAATEIHRFWLHTTAKSSGWSLEQCRRMSLTTTWTMVPLERARGLEELSLRCVRPPDLSRLGPKPRLHTLTLHSLYKPDLTPLHRSAPALRRLVLRNSRAVLGLEGLEALRLLVLDRVTGPISVGGLRGLTVLGVSGERRLDELDCPPGVAALELWRPPQGALRTPPRWAPQIESMTLTRAGWPHNLRRLDALLPFTGLRVLVLENSHIDDASALREGFPALEVADLRGSLLRRWMRRVWSGEELARLRKRL